MKVQREITKLKAIRTFCGALSKPYDQWSEEERIACAALDRIWREDHGFSARPDLDDRHYDKLGKKLFNADKITRADWRAGIMKLGGKWMESESKYKSDPRFLRRMYQGFCSLWEKAKEALGFGKADVISPFEAVRAEKILESPSLRDMEDFQAACERDQNFFADQPAKTVFPGEPNLFAESGRQNREKAFDSACLAAKIEKQKELSELAQIFKPGSDDFMAEAIKIDDRYEARLKTAFAAKIQEDKRESLITGLGRSEFAKVIATRVFAPALEKPYSAWTQAEKDACATLDEIWRKERGLPRPSFDDTKRWDNLGKKIMNANPRKLSLWKSDVMSAGGAIMEGARKGYAMRAGFWTKAFDRMGAAWDWMNRDPNELSKDTFSPFEAIRAQKILDDPSIGIREATEEVTRYAERQEEKAPEPEKIIPEEPKTTAKTEPETTEKTPAMPPDQVAKPEIEETEMPPALCPAP